MSSPRSGMIVDGVRLVFSLVTDTQVAAALLD
jgi:hypothetical protein